MGQKVLFSNQVAEVLLSVLEGLEFSRLFFLVDENTEKFVLPSVQEVVQRMNAGIIVIPAGDLRKNVDSLQHVWSELGKQGATRSSVLVNLGGGVVSDLGGFAGATFKRGIRFVNVPTTLLSAVDAAVGGKTGINFNGLKNEIGLFREAEAVVVSSCFFRTLPERELKSGFAEMLKHSLLDGDASYRALLDQDFKNADGEEFLLLLADSVDVKRRIVAEDPLEKGIRRALNLGHTVGHAFESLSMRRGKEVPHGYAVAWGLVVEAVLSKFVLGLDSAVLYSLAEFVYRHYGAFPVVCNDYASLLDYMRHDKKSVSGEFNFSLLEKPGKVKVDCCLGVEEVKTALDVYRDLMHC